MKIRVLVCASAVAAFGLVSFGLAQNEPAGPSRVSPEQLLLRQATALAIEGRFQEAWESLIVPSGRGDAAIAPPSTLGWRVASVAGALRNRSDHEAADGFARFALMQSWTEPGRSLSRGDKAEAGYWCAWLAAEILSDRFSALEWIEEAEKADPEAKRIRDLKARLVEAERSFPSR